MTRRGSRAAAREPKRERGTGVRPTLAAAAEWRLLGLLLERPRPRWRQEIDALAAESEDTDLRAAAAATAVAGEGEYLRWLGPGGAVSPREVSYRALEDPGWVIADVARFYEAFAFHPRAEDPLDHVAVEAGFVGYLYLKEAFAQAGEDGEAAAMTAAARQRFLETHLASMAEALRERLEAGGPAHLLMAARCLAGRVPANTRPATIAPPDVDVPCGACIR